MTMRVLFASLITLASLLVAQDAPKPDAAPKVDQKADARNAPAPRPMGPPTNLKVLKLTQGNEVAQVMRTFTAGLGVQCAYCHAENGFASDEKEAKVKARHMIEMTQKINANFPDGKMHVSCFTCHRGEAEPKTAPEPRAPGPPPVR